MINFKTEKLFSVISVFCAIVFLTACSNAIKENSNSEKKDSLVINDKQLEKSVGLFKETTLPFTVDTALLFRIEKCDSLGGFEIKTLAANCFKHDLIGGLEYDLKTFYQIDSIKAAGKYKQYCDSLDIGMTKISTARAINEIQLDPNTLILVWGLRTSSYEACPYSSTWSVYFTVIYKGNVAETFLLGEYISAGDAPVAMQRTVTGKLLAGRLYPTFAIDVTQINDQDMDLPEVVIHKEQYVFAIKDGAIKLVSEKKNPETKVARKTVGF